MINKLLVMSPLVGKKETQAFLGIMGFWRMRIPGYSQFGSPLCWVTWKNFFDWGPEQQQAVEQIKQQILHAEAHEPVQTGPNLRNALYATAEDHDLNWSFWQKTPGSAQSASRVLELGV